MDENTIFLILFFIIGWFLLRPSSRKHARRRQNKKHLYEKQDGHCNGCQEEFFKHALTFDHILARKRGGGNNISNLQLLCRRCNSIKGERPMSYLLDRLNKSQQLKQ